MWKNQWQCTYPTLLSMWQHCPGGELLRQPPPWAKLAVPMWQSSETAKQRNSEHKFSGKFHMNFP